MVNEVWVLRFRGKILGVYTDREGAKNFVKIEFGVMWEDYATHSRAQSPTGGSYEAERYKVRGGSCD